MKHAAVDFIVLKLISPQDFYALLGISSEHLWALELS